MRDGTEDDYEDEKDEEKKMEDGTVEEIFSTTKHAKDTK